jgi:hypothetical protein
VPHPPVATRRIHGVHPSRLTLRFWHPTLCPDHGVGVFKQSRRWGRGWAGSGVNGGESRVRVMEAVLTARLTRRLWHPTLRRIHGVDVLVQSTEALGSWMGWIWGVNDGGRG